MSANGLSEHFEMVILNMHQNEKKKKMTAYVTERKRVIITLWTFTVTVVPARPLSFCAAASLSTPSSLSPEVPKT